LGIVRKQAINNTIFSYIGVALGYVNLILLFPRFFSSEQFGLIQLMVSVSFVYAQFSSIGLVNTITRFFPFFKSDDKHHNLFISYIIVFGVSGFIITTFLYIFIKPLIVDIYIEKSKLFIDYYTFIIPLSLFTLAFNVFEALTRVIYKTILSTFVREVLIRLLTTIIIFLYVLNFINFDIFILLFVGIYGLSSLFILFQIILSKEYRFELSIKNLNKNKFVELIKYGTYNLFSGAAMFIGQKIDIMMIGSMVGLSIVGAYSLFLYIATVIYVPMKALSKISVPIIANSWKENDIKQINNIYKRTSLIQLIFGILIYIGVIINKNSLFVLLKKPEYIQNFDIFYFVGLAILIDVAVGLNSEIIASSKYYRYDALFNTVLLIVSIISNFIFIPILGGVGAAIAASISFFIFNFIKWLFLFIKYKMQPLNFKQIFIIIFGIICILINYFIPQLENIYLDIFIRSSIISIIYCSLLYFSKISSDLNERVQIYFHIVFKKAG